MNKTRNIDTFLSQLDLTATADLLIAFHLTQHWPKTSPMVHAESAQRLPAIQTYAPLIFGATDTEHTSAVVRDFLLELGGVCPPDHPKYPNRPTAPRSWLIVFREAFARGQLSPVAFGAAFSFLMRRAGNWTADFPMHTVDAKRIMLADLRASSPLGLMTDEQRATLARAPDTVTIYRGGRGKLGSTPHENSRAVFWALEESLAAKYMGARGCARTFTSLIRGQQAITMAFGAGQQAHSNLFDDLGAPFLLRAKVPKELILAFNDSMLMPHRGDYLRHVEVLVDFDRIAPNAIQDITPQAQRWAA